jgi:3-dehydroquinate synthase
MIIKYKVYDQDYKIILTKKVTQSILIDLKNLNCDKKLIFIYDKNIDKLIIKNIKEELKKTYFSIFFLELVGNKINKTEKSIFKILDFLILNNFTRNSVILSCSGGVIGDMAALAACLYMRGIIYLHIPTTMMSIIDSCVGGKTGINYKGFINSVGTYYHSKSVYISSEILKKIPSREYYSGITEIIKYGLIKKKSILKIINSKKKLIDEKNIKFMFNLIEQSLRIKIHYFSKDVYEKDKRLVLNFGHTFAHAIEMATQKYFGKEIFRHGEAVGIGILCELYYANKGKSKILTYVENSLKKYELPVRILKNKSVDYQKIHSQIFKFIFLDKKKVGVNPRYIHLNKIGMPKIKLLNDHNLINETISKFLF